MTLHELLHACWGQARRSPDYDKETWTQLQAAITELEEVETCLLAAAYRAARTVDLLERCGPLEGHGRTVARFRARPKAAPRARSSPTSASASSRRSSNSSPRSRRWTSPRRHRRLGDSRWPRLPPHAGALAETRLSR